MNPFFDIHFVAGIGVGLLIGFTMGYIIAKRSKKPDSNVTGLQLLAVLSTLGYILMSYGFERDPSPAIAAAILVIGYGAKGGQLLEKILEKKK